MKGLCCWVRMFIVSGHEPVIDKHLNTQQEVLRGTDCLLTFHYEFSVQCYRWDETLLCIIISNSMKQ
jgi:hypothetical protein